MDATIYILQTWKVRNQRCAEIETLCRELKVTKCPTVFVEKVVQVTELLKLHGWPVMAYRNVTWIVVSGLLIECFRRKVHDSSAVSSILSCVEEHFPVAHTKFLLQRELPFSWDGRFLPFRTDEARADEYKKTSLGMYCLNHANKSRLRLHNQRYVTLLGLVKPSCLSLKAARKVPDYILKILQCGGRMSDDNRICRSYVPDILIDVLHLLINHGAKQDHWDKDTLELKVERSNMTTEVKNLCFSFHALLRDVYNPHEATFYLAGRIAKRDMHCANQTIEIPGLEKLLPFYDQLFPGCLYGRRTPPSLSHMCRHRIRKILYDNWELPEGIQSLLIPALLKDYLNLLHG